MHERAPFLTLDDSYAVGMKEMDQEHQALATIANELHDKLEQGRSEEILGQVLDSLVGYARHHFGTEERLMAAAGYPDRPQHQDEHERFARKVSSLHARFHRGDASLARTALDLLKGWLLGHIATHDRRLALFMREHREVQARTQLEMAYAEIDRLKHIIQSAVPRPFLNRLLASRSRVDEVRFLEEGSMSLFFGDIRSYSRYAERMSSPELLGFLNRVFGLLGPRISRNHGFIDKFMGDGVMAIFDREDSAAHAVQAAVEIQDELQEYNRRGGEAAEDLEFGIGINTGPVVIGLLGSSSRFSSTVVGDHVNLASRLEELTKRFQSRILISHHTYAALPQSRHLIREIASVRVRGRSQATTVYEVFDNESPAVREKKLLTREWLARGIARYRDRAFSEALATFQRCLESFPEDRVALEYVRRCHYFTRHAPPPGEVCWDEMVQASGSIFERSLLRQSTRHPVGVTVELDLNDSGGPLPAKVKDLSQGGMRVEVRSRLRQGSLVNVGMSLSDTPWWRAAPAGRFELLCQVLWSRPSPAPSEVWQAGLEVVAADPAAEVLLRDLGRCSIQQAAHSCPLIPGTARPPAK